MTFLQVPAAELVRSLRAGRLLAAALVVNFFVVPLVVAAMFAFLPADQAVRLGVLLVLLTPCVDYVIVLSGPAGATADGCWPPRHCCLQQLFSRAASSAARAAWSRFPFLEDGADRWPARGKRTGPGRTGGDMGGASETRP
ncbi:hypothetical protein [Streptosporangium roseum]|uniref:hypothetical protein n=1 Tax=Streptosporangium roseum TaxID=2001 RepID=UPI00332AE052